MKFLILLIINLILIKLTKIVTTILYLVVMRDGYILIKQELQLYLWSVSLPFFKEGTNI